MMRSIDTGGLRFRLLYASKMISVYSVSSVRFILFFLLQTLFLYASITRHVSLAAPTSVKHALVSKETNIGVKETYYIRHT
jgi:hypothetical protein